MKKHLLLLTVILCFLGIFESKVSAATFTVFTFEISNGTYTNGKANHSYHSNNKLADAVTALGYGSWRTSDIGRYENIDAPRNKKERKKYFQKTMSEKLFNVDDFFLVFRNKSTRKIHFIVIKNNIELTVAQNIEKAWNLIMKNSNDREAMPEDVLYYNSFVKKLNPFYSLYDQVHDNFSDFPAFHKLHPCCLSLPPHYILSRPQCDGTYSMPKDIITANCSLKEQVSELILPIDPSDDYQKERAFWNNFFTPLSNFTVFTPDGALSFGEEKLMWTCGTYGHSGTGLRCEIYTKDGEYRKFGKYFSYPYYKYSINLYYRDDLPITKNKLERVSVYLSVIKDRHGFSETIMQKSASCTF